MTKFNLGKIITAGLVSAACLLPTLAAANSCGMSCDPCCQDDCGFYVGGDVLYWTACQECLEVGSTTEDITVDIETGKVTTTAKIHVADYNWDLGFRVFAGYRMGCDDWELRGVYTYWNNDATGNIRPNLLGVKTSTNNDFKYQTADALLYREYILGCSSKLRPFAGFRALWIDQKFRVETKIVGPETSEIAVEPLILSQLKLDSDLFAAGMTAGIDWEWTLCDGFGVYVGMSGSLLEGDTDNRHAFLRLESPIGPTSSSFSSSAEQFESEFILKDDRCLPIPGYHLNAGVTWESCFDMCGMESWLKFSLGYELNHWFQVPTFNPFGLLAGQFEGTSTTSQTDVNVPFNLLTCKTNSVLLHGLTARVSYLF